MCCSISYVTCRLFKCSLTSLWCFQLESLKQQQSDGEKEIKDETERRREEEEEEKDEEKEKQKENRKMKEEEESDNRSSQEAADMVKITLTEFMFTKT